MAQQAPRPGFSRRVVTFVNRCALTVVAATVVVLGMLIAMVPGTIATATATPTKIFVANAGSPSSVTVLNGGTDALETTIPVPNAIAVGVGVAPNGKEAYVIAVGSDEEGSPGRLIPISTVTNRVGKAISVGTDPQSITFNSNGRFAYVVDGFDAATTPTSAPGTITPVNLSEGVAGKPIRVGTNPASMAISPDGRVAYVANSNAVTGKPTTITPIDLETNTPERAIPVAARAIAVTSNGQTALAVTSTGVVPISIPSNHVGRVISLNGTPQDLALAPDGQTAWVLTTPNRTLASGSKKLELTAINTSTDALGKVVTLPAMPTSGQFFLAITPDGGQIYVLGQGSGKSPSTLIAVAGATDAASKPIKVGVGDTGLDVSPNSEVAYVLSPGSDYQGPPIASQPKPTPGMVFPVSTSSERTLTPVRVGLLASAIAVAP
jgi:DNA-binding beta-propeller fold protein YncE